MITNRIKEVFDEVENSSVMQKLWEAYHKEFSYASDLEWSVIIEQCRQELIEAEKNPDEYFIAYV